MRKILKRPDPIDIDFVNMRIYRSHNTLCQELREIYHLLNEEQDKIKVKVRVAMSMAKKVTAKLAE